MAPDDVEDFICCLLFLIIVGGYALYATNPETFWAIINGVIIIIVLVVILGIGIWLSKKGEKPKPQVPPRPLPKPQLPKQRTIKCPHCNFENPEGLNFCGRCGAALVHEEETRIYG